MDARPTVSRAGLWLRRILLALVGLVVLLVLSLGGVIVYDAATVVPVTAVANVEIPGPEGLMLHGYLARPPDAGPHPAVLLIHEWWGLNADITALADALVAQGYVVLAPDAYRGQVGRTVPRALWLRLTTPASQIAVDLDAAFGYLRSAEGVDAARTAAAGFCFGGGEALLLSLRQPAAIAATVVYYGSVVTDPQRLETLSTPLLGIFGAEDAQIPVAEVRRFAAALETAGVPHQVTIYPGVGHAFLSSENYAEPGPAGEAWQEMLAFLNANLRP